jgi:DNA repair exonuclease SbcCD ATPase subunit
MAFLLSQSPGMLVLDEPGAGLDTANRAYLRTALQHFQSVAKSRGLQIIMITHDESMESSFNQVIQL